MVSFSHTHPLTKSRAGFSLIELIVVIAITGILSTVTLIAFWQYQARVALETEAQAVSTVIEKARNYALTGKQISGTDNTCQSMYTVSFEKNTGFYTIDPQNLCVKKEPYILGGGVVFEVAPLDVIFKAPHGFFSTPAGTQKIVLARGDLRYTLCVLRSGIVKEMGFGAQTCP